MNRKHFLAASAAAAGSAVATPVLAQSVTLPFDNGDRTLAAFPQKRQLIVLTSRPVQLETPASVFDAGEFTPNDAFFVRWHLPEVPTRIDPAAFRLNVHGAVTSPLSLGLDDLRTQFEPVEVNAVLECAGNSRGFSAPRVPGGQWANGAMGNARWRGARLRDILAHSYARADAVQVRFQGAERPALATTPQFLKSLDVAVASDPNVIVAYEMNGADLPVLNGFPVRLVVPGWFGTYWVKALNDIEVLLEPDQNYWMKTAYRVPNTPNYSVAPTDTGFATVPLSHLTVRSFITNLTDGAAIGAGRTTIRGIAFDGGTGIRNVGVSTDGGTTWRDAELGPDLGKFSFRRWTATFDARPGQRYVLASRAVNNGGEQQVHRWNPSGYARNAVENVTVAVKA
jgi:DMSO/TMAO reductase YedYZ molybdopterin-dependent catalytic subunit